MHISIKATSEVKGHAREAMFLSGNVPFARRFWKIRQYSIDKRRFLFGGLSSSRLLMIRQVARVIAQSNAKGSSIESNYSPPGLSASN